MNSRIDVNEFFQQFFNECLFPLITTEDIEFIEVELKDITIHSYTDYMSNHMSNMEGYVLVGQNGELIDYIENVKKFPIKAISRQKYEQSITTIDSYSIDNGMEII